MVTSSINIDYEASNRAMNNGSLDDNMNVFVVIHHIVKNIAFAAELFVTKMTQESKSPSCQNTIEEYSAAIVFSDMLIPKDTIHSSKIIFRSYFWTWTICLLTIENQSHFLCRIAQAFTNENMD